MFTKKQKVFDLDDFSQISAAPQNADNSAARNAYKRFIWEALQFLPPKQRETIILYYLENMRTPAIARMLSVSASTVSRRLNSARRTLQALARLCIRSGLFPS